MPLNLESLPAPDGWAAQSRASDPGRFADLIAAVPAEPEAISAVARNVIAHYRADAEHLPAGTRGDINLRRVERQLEVDQQRHPYPLDVERPIDKRLQGCCRDHTLFALAVFRQHGIPARSRVGFASYFRTDWNHDHVVPEYWDGRRWRRFDPEVASASPALPNPLDMEIGPSSPFKTAAETLTLLRAGEIDPELFGVAPGLPFCGEKFIVDEVFYELAHRYGDETLLWDGWGAMAPPDEPATPESAQLVGEVAAMLLAADAGDLEVESRLHARYREDQGLNPGPTVMQFSPFGDPPVPIEL
jgi:Transglutaminase-like superfamily